MDTRYNMTVDQLILALAPIGAAIFVCILHNAVKIARVAKDIQWIKKILDLQFNNPGENDH